MNESDWLAVVTTPRQLFNHIKSSLSARKLQLLACGCCRLLAPLLSADQRAALGWVERHADRLATDDEYERAKGLFLRGANDLLVPTPTGGSIPPTPEAAIADALVGVVSTPSDIGLQRVLDWVPAAAARATWPDGPRPTQREMARRLCGVFHEVVGNPYRVRMVAGPEWQTEGRRPARNMLKVSETARGIALGVQADQAYDRLPILADALEDDGCTDAELLEHLRDNSHHLRGCWAVDLVLGKS